MTRLVLPLAVLTTTLALSLPIAAVPLTRSLSWGRALRGPVGVFATQRLLLLAGRAQAARVVGVGDVIIAEGVDGAARCEIAAAVSRHRRLRQPDRRVRSLCFNAHGVADDQRPRERQVDNASRAGR